MISVRIGNVAIPRRLCHIIAKYLGGLYMVQGIAKTDRDRKLVTAKLRQLKQGDMISVDFVTNDGTQVKERLRITGLKLSDGPEEGQLQFGVELHA
jgi:hypothetical protein